MRFIFLVLASCSTGRTFPVRSTSLPLLVAFALMAMGLGQGVTPAQAGYLRKQESNQNSPRNLLSNGGFEQLDDRQAFTAWRYQDQAGKTISADTQATQEGTQSAKIDTTTSNGPPVGIFGLAQSIDISSLVGKTIRYRASVRTENLAGQAQAQLWARIDCRRSDQEEPFLGGFDNMSDRPIRSSDWAAYDIILKVPEHADQIVVGIFLTGTGQAWIDQASLQVVSDTTPETSRAPTAMRSPLMAKALRDAANAPTQPFFTLWLILPCLAIIAFVIAMVGPTTKVASEEPEQWGPIRSFLFRFTVAYWFFYTLPTFFIELIPWMGSKWSSLYSDLHSQLIHASARYLLGISGPMVPPLGSGDTTFNYVAILTYFLLSVIVAIGTSLWRPRLRRPKMQRDLLRSYLRYVLAMAMLTYGLIKVTMVGNQFPYASAGMLERTFADASPMGLIWTMMGASRAYTVFAGLGELTGALLLIWRRTALLGALVTTGVMANVVMLNFCYDIPVKLYSSHLLMMAVLIAVPETGRLIAMFFQHTAIPAQSVGPPWENRVIARLMLVLKVLILLLGFAIPIYQHVRSNAEYIAQGPSPSESDAPAPRLISRGFRWINEVPFNR